MLKLFRIIPTFVILWTSCFAIPDFARQDYLPPEQKTPYGVPSAQYKDAEGAFPYFIDATYTYYVPYLEGVNISYNDGTQTTQGNTVQPKTQARSGFILGMGVNLFHDGWLAELRYMWFYNDPHTEENSLVTGLDNYQSPFSSIDVTSSAISSRFTNYFNRLDGVVHRSFFSGKHLVHTPYLGLSAAWENMYFNMNDTLSSEPEGDILQMRFKQEWWGIGPYAGSSSIYYLPALWNIGLYCNTGGALYLTTHQATKLRRRISPELVFEEMLEYDYNEIVSIDPMVEISLGIKKNFHAKHIETLFHISWDLQTYFSHSAINPFYAPTGIRGNYSMQGLSVGIRINL